MDDDYRKALQLGIRIDAIKWMLALLLTALFSGISTSTWHWPAWPGW